MKPLDTALERLAPSTGWSADWEDVLRRVDTKPVHREHVSRRLVLVLALLAAILVPLAALAASKDWWFFSAGAPQPTQAPVVVKTGNWDGHPWRLIAYPSATDGLCFSVTPPSSTETGASSAMSCGPFAGIPRTSTTKTTADMTITYLSGSDTAKLPAYIAGPVTERASTVAVRLADGRTLTTPTFNAQAPLDHIRFYATPLPRGGNHSDSGKPTSPVTWIAGLDAKGTVVACLAPAKAHDGISRPSDCR